MYIHVPALVTWIIRRYTVEECLTPRSNFEFPRGSHSNRLEIRCSRNVRELRSKSILLNAIKKISNVPYWKILCSKLMHEI